MAAADILQETVFHRSDSASLSRLSANEGIMMAFEAGLYVRLNESAMVVWELVDGQLSCGSLIDRYARYFSLPVSEAEPAVCTCLAQLIDLQVIYA